MGHPPSKILRDLWGFVSMPLQHLQGKRKTQQNPQGLQGYWGWAAFHLRLGRGELPVARKGEAGQLPPLLPGSACHPQRDPFYAWPLMPSVH